MFLSLSLLEIFIMMMVIMIITVLLQPLLLIAKDIKLHRSMLAST